jgi:putative hemolysin
MSFIRDMFQNLRKLFGKTGLPARPSSLGEKGQAQPEMENVESICEEIGGQGAELKEDEKKMIYSILEFGETLAKEIMVPRIDMVCVEADAPLEKIKELVKRVGYSRIPLYQDNIDNIVGVLHMKDLFLEENKEGLDLSSIARKPYFIPETKKIAELLREMKKQKTHIAIVMDEYGGTAGLITMEDILEEIVGEIRDEYDVGEEDLIKKLDEENYRVSANLSLADLNETLGTDLPEKEFETVGGYIYDLVGSVPEQGKILESSGLKFLVEKVVGQRISTVKITKIKSEEPSP